MSGLPGSDQELVNRLIRDSKQAAEKIGAGLESGEDWEPMAAIISSDRKGEPSLTFIQLYFDSDESKRKAFEEVLPAAITGSGARAVALLLPSWISLARPTGPLVRPSADPKRREVLIAVGISLSFSEYQMAEVIRGEEISLGPWEKLPGSTIGGMISDSLRAALRSAAASQN